MTVEHVDMRVMGHQKTVLAAGAVHATGTGLNSVKFDFTGLPCPMAECGEPLQLGWHAGYLLSVGDLADIEHPPAIDGAHTESWNVECINGHVVLLPGPLGCGCDDDEPCPHDDDEYDWSDDSRTFRKHDVERLRKLVASA